MIRPSVEPSIHASRSYTRAASGTVGIDVERATVPGHALGLDLELVRIAMAMTAHRHRRTERNDAFLEPGPFRPRRRGEDDVPHLAVRFYTHRGVRTGEADCRLEGAGELELLILITAPPVVGSERQREGEEREGERTDEQRPSWCLRVHTNLQPLL